MRVLGIETSCDETGLAVYDTARGLLAQRVHSQVAMHRDFGGVVPELASRDHLHRVLPLLEEVLAASDSDGRSIDGIAVTEGPGLAGALLVGASIAHAISFAWGKPVIGVHHLEGHLLSPLLAPDPPEFPFLALLVSGGHTQLQRVDSAGTYTLLGDTLDDAAGEAFDKTAQLLGLGYPGGPAVSALADRAGAARPVFPRPMLHSGDLNFSFSGLKTAVLTEVRRRSPAGAPLGEADQAAIAAGFVDAVVDVLAAKALHALRAAGLKRLVVAGGVGANRQLRGRLTKDVATVGATVHFPPLDLCTDNGAMIALAGALRFTARKHGSPARAFGVRPRWLLQEA